MTRGVALLVVTLLVIGAALGLPVVQLLASCVVILLLGFCLATVMGLPVRDSIGAWMLGIGALALILPAVGLILRDAVTDALGEPGGELCVVVPWFGMAASLVLAWLYTRPWREPVVSSRPSVRTRAHVVEQPHDGSQLTPPRFPSNAAPWGDDDLGLLGKGDDG